MTRMWNMCRAVGSKRDIAWIQHLIADLEDKIKIVMIPVNLNLK